MRPAHHRIRAKLEAGEKAYGIAVQLPSPEIVEAVGWTGYDFVWIDAEHGSLDFSEIRELIRAADAADIDALVRVMNHDPSAIQQVLDLGAAGIIAPDVRTVADAEALVSAAHFGPGGTRGACPCGRAVGHLTHDWAADVRRMDANVLLFAIIEHPDGVQNAEGIAGAGVDGLLFGPFDLAMTLGLGGDVHHPQIAEMQKHVIEATRSAGIEYVSPNVAWEEDLDATGCRVIPVTGDRVALVTTFQRLLAEAKGAPAPAPSIA